MKAETDPITPDEWLLRIVHIDKFTNGGPPISPNSFEPRVKGKQPDVTGLSLFRKDCLRDPDQVLLVVTEDKRPLKGIVLIPVTLLAELNLTVIPEPIPEVPGHVVIPELNSGSYSAGKARFTPIQRRLAEVASQNIHRQPVSQPGC